MWLLEISIMLIPAKRIPRAHPSVSIKMWYRAMISSSSWFIHLRIYNITFIYSSNNAASSSELTELAIRQGFVFVNVCFFLHLVESIVCICSKCLLNKLHTLVKNLPGKSISVFHMIFNQLCVYIYFVVYSKHSSVSSTNPTGALSPICCIYSIFQSTWSSIWIIIEDEDASVCLYQIPFTVYVHKRLCLADVGLRNCTFLISINVR